MELALYLLPVTLGDTPIETVLPPYNKEIILGEIYIGLLWKEIPSGQKK